MEWDGDQLSARPALKTEGLRFLHVTVGSLLATYGWYIVFNSILLYVVFQKLSTRLRALRQRHLDQAAAALEPDIVVKQQEALAAALLKMQEELNAQVEKHKEKLRQLEEEKGDRRLKCGIACKKEKVIKEIQESLRKKTVLGLLIHQASQNENLTESLCEEEVPILCLVKVVEPAPGDLDPEDPHLVDEAKNLVSVTFDISKMNP